MTFEMWGVGHYIFLIAPFIITIVLHVSTKKKTYKFKQNLGIILSVIAVIILLLRNIEIYFTHGQVFDYELLPLQICHFANFVLLYAFMTDSKSFFGLAVLFNLPMAFLSILFANSLENYATILTLRGGAYIIGHILIVVITIWAYLNGFVKLNKKVLGQTMSIVLVLYILGLVMNNVMLLTTGEASNYFYATRPEHGTPLELFFHWGVEYNLWDMFILNPIYLILMASLGLMTITVSYIILKLFQKKDKSIKETPFMSTAGYRSFMKE